MCPLASRSCARQLHGEASVPRAVAPRGAHRDHRGPLRATGRFPVWAGCRLWGSVVYMLSVSVSLRVGMGICQGCLTLSPHWDTCGWCLGTGVGFRGCRVAPTGTPGQGGAERGTSGRHTIPTEGRLGLGAGAQTRHHFPLRKGVEEFWASAWDPVPKTPERVTQGPSYLKKEGKASTHSSTK